MKDPLFFNKISSALLACSLLYFGIPIMVDKLTSGGHHGTGHRADHTPPEDNPLELAYPIEFSFGPKSRAVAVPQLDIGTLLANADPARGQRKIAKCTSCHTLDAGGGNLLGPNLYDIIGRPVASVAGFAYSTVVKEAGGVWSYERLNSYIENSQNYLPGTAMVQKIKKPAERADILAFLSTLSSDPVAFPAPPLPSQAAENAEESLALEDIITPIEETSGEGAPPSTPDETGRK